jgi:uncharacterized protein (TIGR02300 family)
MKPEWGHKRNCQSCSARFYDLNKNPATCPKCGKEFDPSTAVKKRRGRPPLAEKKKAEAEAAAVAAKSKTKEDDLDVGIETDEDIDIDEDDALLVTDDDDDLEDTEVVPSLPSREED